MKAEKLVASTYNPYISSWMRTKGFFFHRPTAPRRDLIRQKFNVYVSELDYAYHSPGRNILAVFAGDRIYLFSWPAGKEHITFWTLQAVFSNPYGLHPFETIFTTYLNIIQPCTSKSN